MRDALFFSKLRVMLCGWRWKSHRRASWLKARLRRLRHSARRAAIKSLFAWRGPSAAPSRSSQFSLEPLEARVLLAADLTGVVQSAATLDPAVPTNTASAVEEQSAVTSEVASNMQSASQAVNSISSNMSEIVAAVQQAAGAVATTKEAAKVLAR